LKEVVTFWHHFRKNTV